MKHDVMFGILITLLNSGKTTAKVLAERFEVSTKTIYRYLSILESSGVPTISYAGRYGGIEIANTFSLSSCYFSKQEISEIFSLMSNSTIPKLSNSHNLVTEKLKSTLKNANQCEFAYDYHTNIIIDTSPWGKHSQQNTVQCELLKAIEESTSIKISYCTEKLSQKRIIHPYSIIFKDGSFYLYAFCTMRNNFRLFKLTRIANVDILDKTFIRQKISQEELLKMIEKSFERVEITLQTDDIIANDLSEWLSDCNIKTQKNDTIIKGQAIKNRGLVHKLMTYENKLKIISPQWLKEELLNACNNICSTY